MLTDLLGLTTKPKNATQPGVNADSEQLALRDRMKKRKKTEETEEPSVS